METTKQNLLNELRRPRKIVAHLQTSGKNESDTQNRALTVLQLNKPPCFNIKGCIDNWPFQVENYLKRHSDEDNDQGATYATGLIKGDAATWWRSQNMNNGSHDELRKDWA